MKLFVFEYASAGGEGGEPFLKEGTHMLSSLLGDLARLKSVEVSTILSPEVKGADFPAHRIVRPIRNFNRAVEDEMNISGAVWLIAPETGGILMDITRMAEAMGKRIIGSTSRAIELFSDKMSTAKRFEGLVPMPRTAELNGNLPFIPAIIKPVDGAGCDGIFRVDETSLLPSVNGRYICQPFIEGDTLSAGAIADAKGIRLLGVCRQDIEVRGRVTFKGVSGPVEYRRSKELLDILGRLWEVSDRLAGYFGVDFIDNGKEIIIIEVNPRLTTSYPLYSKNFPGNLGGEILSACGAELVVQ
ncbi:MAG: ATP-grasp domain-containing protein [Nitrospinota bacterium]|nr:ATP-grasp domain-containing protein [Nitrospinota bacterium]